MSPACAIFTIPPPLAAVKTHTPYTKRRHSLTPDNFASLIDNSKIIGQLLQIHASLFRHGLETHPPLNFKLQRAYSTLGRLDYSVVLFRRIHNPNVFSYTAIIHAHVINNLHQQALHIFIEMLSQSIEPNAFTFSAILKGCPPKPARALHCQALKTGCDSNTYVRTVLVDVYARGGDMPLARQLFDTMPEKSLVSTTTMITGLAKHGDVHGARVLFDGMLERDVVSWNVMIHGYAQNGRPNEALFLFRKMMSAEMRPDSATLVAVLSACGQLGALESGRWVHSFMEDKEIRTNVRVGAALVDMYSKCGSLKDARLVFDKIMYKDVVAWNSMISGYALNGFSQEALELFSDMCRMSVIPTDITFIAILSACAHSGLADEAWFFFNSMKAEYGIEPKVEHYGCMVNLLGRLRKLEEAFELVQGMNINPDPIIWGTLLGACRLHGNNDLGEQIVEFLVNHDLANSGTYVVLSNIYAATGNWDGVARMRTVMKDSGLQKEPGCSSIEINNTVHEFLAGDVKHPLSKEIYSTLEKINGWLCPHVTIHRQMY